MFPLVNLWEKGYTKQYPGIKLSTTSSNSSTGVTDAGQGLVDIGASDNSMSATQTTQYPSLENIPLGADGIEIMYNLPGLKAPLNLSGTLLAQIYDGKITTWNDPAIAKVNPGVTLPSTKIVTVHRADSAAASLLLSEYMNAQDASGWPTALVASSPTWPKTSGALAETGAGAMVTGAGSTVGAISYTGSSYGTQIKAAKLSTAALLNGGGKYVTATTAAVTAAVNSFPAPPASGKESLINTTSAAGYPISGYEYAIVSTSQKSSTQAALIQNFLTWAITTGSTDTYLSQVGFVALPSATDTVSKALIAKISS
jgi:phosphate transport system substrate-binding protein